MKNIAHHRSYYLFYHFVINQPRMGFSPLIDSYETIQKQVKSLFKQFNTQFAIG